MTWNVRPESDPHSTIINLGTAHLGSDQAGEAVPLIVRNDSDYVVQGVVIGAKGNGSNHVQFAQDRGGEPGVWAEAGREVIAYPGRVKPEESFRVWARVAAPDEEEAGPGIVNFSFVIKGVPATVQ